MPTDDRTKSARVLLLECNNMKKWVGTTMPTEVFVRFLADDLLSSIAGEG
jgi:hypothetical protein